VSDQWTYDAIAGEFDSIMNRYDLNRRLDAVFDRMLGDVDLNGKKVLDAGCGTGFFSAQAARRGASVTGLDVGVALLREARRKGITAVVAGDAARMPIPDGCFDVVVSSECIEHTPSPRDTLRELIRVIRPGGWLAITCPNAIWRWSCTVANTLHLRPYKGLENWPGWGQLRSWAGEGGMEVRQHFGLHLFPFVIRSSHSALRLLDRMGHRLGRVYVNQCLLGQKMGGA
jgi:2-polyprenyl-6-hydroxyphenyl methylase/3-demethylubiquinone-9 3-methyltransferase